MSNWQEKINNLEDQEKAYIQQQEAARKAALVEKTKAAEVRMSELERMMEAIGVVKALDGVNREIWEGMGKVDITDEKDSGILKAILSFNYKAHYMEREDLHKKVHGTYTYTTGGREGFETRHTEKGWHDVYIGYRVVGISTFDMKTFIEVVLISPRGEEGDMHELAIRDEPVKFNSEEFKKFMDLSDWRSFRISGRSSFHKSDGLSAYFISNEDAIARASKFLDIVLALDCRERIQSKHFPRYLLETQYRTFAEISATIGQRFLE